MDPLGPTLRRTRRREHPGWRALAALALSLVLNLLIVTQLDASWLVGVRSGERRDVTMAPLAAADWEANRTVRPRGAPPLAPAVPPPPLTSPTAPGQVVELGDQPPTKKPPPKETRFVSDRDSAVDRETRARVTKAPGQKVTPTPTGPVALVQPGQGGTSERAIPGTAGPKGAPAQAEQPPPGQEPSPAAAGERQAARDQAIPRGTGEGGEQRRGDPRLAIPASTLARLAGAASPDHLQGVEEGDGTYLNTREWKYASYFNRIKESVGSAWDPRRALDQRDPERTIYAFKDRYTLLSVTLDEKGGVKDLAVARTSNVDFLDRTALDAFRKAQPFANPPTGLVDGSGEIRFVFGFYLEVGRPGLRIYRGTSPF